VRAGARLADHGPRMMTPKVTLIQGGGAGYDQVPAVQKLLAAAGAAIEWEEHPAGLAALERGLSPLPEELLASVRRNGLALKTKLLAPSTGPHGNYNVQLRRALGLFASVRPLKNLRGLPARFQNVDLLVIRELTEDLYAAIEHEIVPGVVQSIKVVTEAACRRFFRFAFEWSRAHGRKAIHCVHKANILKLADGLFLEVFRAVGRDFPDLQQSEIIVDNCCMQLVSRPSRFDVLVMGNLYGDLVSDLGAGLVGGISTTAGINVGEGVRVYEAFHGGTREEIGAGRANPLPLLLPAIDLLEGIGQKVQAERLLKAVQDVLETGRLRTPDLGGTATTTELADAIAKAVASG
jgi:isocitrate dehydrogenase (NAD+)